MRDPVAEAPMLRTSLLVLSALCTLATAQPGRKATRIGNAEDYTVLGPSTDAGSVFASLSPGVDQVHELNFYPSYAAATGNTVVPGKFFLVASVTRTGQGTPSVLMGLVDTTVAAWTFTEQNFITAVNTTGYVSPSMSADLLVFCVDDGTSVKWSTRADRSLQFQTLVDTGIGSLSEPFLFERDGIEFMGFINTPNFKVIDCSIMDRTRYPLTPRVNTNFETLVPPPFLDCHSPAFLRDASGNARAIAHSTDMGGPGSGKKARPWYNAIVRGTVQNLENSQQFHTGPNDDTDMSHPGVIAGTTYYAQRPPAGIWGTPKKIRILACSGGAVPTAGGTFRLSLWAPYQEAAGWAVAVMIGEPANDVTIPGWAGKWALDLTKPFFVLPPKLWSGNDTSKDYVVPAPAAMAGTPLWTQALAFDATGTFGFQWALGNTGPLIWQ